MAVLTASQVSIRDGYATDVFWR